MISPKEQMVDIVLNQPEDSSYEEILRELAFARMIERGLADADAGRVLSNAQMENHIAKWLK